MTDEELMVRLYDRMKRPCREGSLSEAIRYHSQACGLIAYLLDSHPDTVAQAIRHAAICRGHPLKTT